MNEDGVLPVESAILAECDASQRVEYSRFSKFADIEHTV